MEILNRVIAIWNNKKQRNGVILSLLSIILILIIVNKISNMETPPPPGAKRAVICSSCKHIEVQRIQEVDDARCTECRESVGLAWKCGKCQYEYSAANLEFDTENLNTMQRFQKAAASRSCPNCGMDKDIGPMSIKEARSRI